MSDATSVSDGRDFTPSPSFIAPRMALDHIPVDPVPPATTGGTDEAVWDEALALAFHDAIDGDLLIDAGGEDHAVGISVLRVSEAVRWATRAVLASDWLRDRDAARAAALRADIARDIEAATPVPFRGIGWFGSPADHRREAMLHAARIALGGTDE